MTQETFEPKAFSYFPISGVVANVEGSAWFEQRLPAGVELLLKVDWRTPKPLSEKLNPIWWFLNEWDIYPPEWYMPGDPEWKRKVYWWCKNSFHNFGRYVLGVGDQNYVVRITRQDGLDIHGDSFGWQVGELVMPNGGALPWYSYRGADCAFYAGWQPAGSAGIKFYCKALWFSPTLPLILIYMFVRRMLQIAEFPYRTLPKL